MRPLTRDNQLRGQVLDRAKNYGRRLSLTKQVGILLLVPIGVTLVSLGLFYERFSRVAAEGPFIAMAGQQRLLSRQLGVYARMVHIGQEEDRVDLRESIELFEHSLSALEKGGQLEEKVLPPPPLEVRDELAEIRQVWEEVKPALLEVAARPAGDPQGAAAYALVQSRLPLLGDRVRQVVTAYVARSRELKREVLLVLDLAIALGFLLFFLGIWVVRTYQKERRRAEERVQRVLRREQALSRIRDRIIGLRHLSEVPGKLEEVWVGELRSLGLPINKVSLQFPSSSEGCFTTYRDAFLSEVKSADNRLADYPWVGEAWTSGQSVLVNWKRLRETTMSPEVRSLVEVPLPGGGSLGVNSQEEDAFDEEAVQVLEQVAGLLALGLVRLKDFETLRQAEEQLKISLALQQVRNEILLMRGVEDWRKVVVAFEQELRKVIKFEDCGINLLDRQRHSYLDYETATGTVVEKEYKTLPRALVQALDTGEPVYRRNRAEVDQFEDPIKTGTNCVLDVPFAGGTVAINSSEEDAFSARDIQLLERFAQVMSEGHRRLEDLKALALQQAQLHQAQKLEAVGQLATGVAHEINNPLTSVLGYSELLLRHELDPQVRAHMETIHQEGQRAQEIAARLLQFVRRQKASTQPLSLNLIVEEVLELVRQQVGLDHVQLSSALAPDLPQVQASPGQLQQLLLALLQNSREAIKKSGDAGAIKVSTRRQGHQVQLVVEDDGPGIPEALRERIFEPFFTTKEVGTAAGTGMGLSLCYTIAREHSGRLWAEPRAVGACLVLELPTDQVAPSSRSDLQP